MTSWSGQRSLSPTTLLGVHTQFLRILRRILTSNRWSGITEEALRNVTTTHEEVQGHLMALLSVSPTPVLLGHSLESDLCALKLRHGRCIDTALVYHHPRGRPLKPGLAWLTRKWCGREIQARGEGGHDPEEDARACAELLRRKIENVQSTCLAHMVRRI